MTDAPIVATQSGRLRGVAGDGVVRFRNVPYARAARFAPPMPVSPWRGLRGATRHGPVAPQGPSRLRLAMGDFTRPQDEDCLSLTIATPAADGARRPVPNLPVIVFLHGGAYLSGAGSLDWYDGAPLARAQDVVVVGVNYRLGLLGFLAHPGVADGRMALEDISAALDWVAANIAAFGGDPERVTVAGQSAGAHVIMCLLAEADTRPPFRRAVLQSPPATLAFMAPEVAADHAARVAATLEVPPAGLAGLPVAELLRGQTALLRATAKFGDLMPPVCPVSAAHTMPEGFIRAAAAGAGRWGIDLLLGTVREEMHAFYAPDPAMRALAADGLAPLYARFEPGATPRLAGRRPGAQPWEWAADLVSDHTFHRPTAALASQARAAGAVVFAYRFDWAAPGNEFRACHCLELPFLLGETQAWRRAPMLRGADASWAGLRSAMQAGWGGFAGGGDPAMPGLPWPAWDGHAVMRLDRVCEKVFTE